MVLRASFIRKDVDTMFSWVKLTWYRQCFFSYLAHLKCLEALIAGLMLVARQKGLLLIFSFFCHRGSIQCDGRRFWGSHSSDPSNE